MQLFILIFKWVQTCTYALFTLKVYVHLEIDNLNIDMIANVKLQIKVFLYLPCTVFISHGCPKHFKLLAFTKCMQWHDITAHWPCDRGGIILIRVHRDYMYASKCWVWPDIYGCDGSRTFISASLTTRWAFSLPCLEHVTVDHNWNVGFFLQMWGSFFHCTLTIEWIWSHLQEAKALNRTVVVASLLHTYMLRKGEEGKRKV